MPPGGPIIGGPATAPHTPTTNTTRTLLLVPPCSVLSQHACLVPDVSATTHWWQVNRCPHKPCPAPHPPTHLAQTHTPRTSYAAPLCTQPANPLTPTVTRHTHTQHLPSPQPPSTPIHSPLGGPPIMGPPGGPPIMKGGRCCCCWRRAMSRSMLARMCAMSGCRGSTPGAPGMPAVWREGGKSGRGGWR